jgi:nucleoside-diphosphate-sugar epimerase
MPTKVLVTGGAGYIGSILVPALLEKGYSVRVVDKFLYNQSSLLDCCANPQFEIERGDCRDEAILKRAMSDADIVLPLAAIVGAPICDSDRIAATSTNLDAVRLVVRLRSPQQRLIFPCTNSGYGIGEKDKYCTEESPMRPISLYGTTKAEAEKAVLDSGGISLRLATVFGVSPRMRTDLLVNDFVYRAVTDRCVLIFEGHFKRNYLHVRDVARVFLHAIDHFDSMSGPYNAGLSDANLSKLELCAKIQQHIPQFVYLEAPIGEDPDKRDYIVSNAKLEGTGFRPAFSIDDGVRELSRAYRIVRNRTYGNY